MGDTSTSLGVSDGGDGGDEGDGGDGGDTLILFFPPSPS